MEFHTCLKSCIPPMINHMASRKNPDVEARYERLVYTGKAKMCALEAASRKLAQMCYGVYQIGEV